MILNQTIEYQDIGVYYIHCIPNDKYYVGYSSNLRQRYEQHTRELRKNQHKNLHLQNAFNRFGEDAFLFSIIAYCDTTETASFLEKQIIEDYDLLNREYGFNMQQSDEFKESISQTRKINMEDYKKTNPYLKSGEDNPRYGKTHEEIYGKEKSKEIKEKLSKTFKENGHPWQGRHHSTETKAKLSKAHKGRKPSKEALENMSKAMRGKTSWKKGKTYEEIYGKEGSDELKTRLVNKFTGKNNHFYGKSHSKETIEKQRQAKLAKSIKCEFVDHEGNKFYPDTMTSFCKEHNLDVSAMSRVRKGERPHHKGWTCREL